MITAGPMLKEARKRAGLTQDELARRLGMTQPAIARLERPGANPRVQTLIDAVEATGHTLDARLEPRRAGIDETLVAASLRESHAERLHHFEALYATARDLSGRAFRRDGS
jgi:transcriptional regulator with XRE-family HTH domain